MRCLILILLASIVLYSQVTAPLPNPYSHSPTTLKPNLRPTSGSSLAPLGMRPVRRPHGYGGGGFIHNSVYETVVVEAASPEKEDKLKELIISPTYKQEKLTPKMIEIP